MVAKMSLAPHIIWLLSESKAPGFVAAALFEQLDKRLFVMATGVHFCCPWLLKSVNSLCVASMVNLVCPENEFVRCGEDN